MLNEKAHFLDVWGCCKLERQAPALSSTEVEYMACTCAAQEAIWLRQLLKQLGVDRRQRRTFMVIRSYCAGEEPNRSPMHEAYRAAIPLHTISNGHISLSYVPTSEMTADRLTKGLTRDKHELFIGMLGSTPHPSGSVEF